MGQMEKGKLGVGDSFGWHSLGCLLGECLGKTWEFQVSQVFGRSVMVLPWKHGMLFLGPGSFKGTAFKFEPLWGNVLLAWENPL